MSDADQELELVVEDQEEFRARRNLQILYDAVEEAHARLQEAQEVQEANPKRAKRPEVRARTHVLRLLAMVRPAMKDTEIWQTKTVGHVTLPESVENEPNVITLNGLSDIYSYRQGIRYTAEVPKPGYGPHTHLKQQVRPLPLYILDDALGAVLEWMQEVDLGMPLEEMGGDTLEL